MDEQFVSIGKAAKMLGMSIDGLRKWEREGRLIPVRTVTNHRRYRVADLRALMHEDAPDVARDTRCLLYARVSTKKQQDAGNLDRQLGRLTAFAAEQRWTVVAALTDVASGLNEKRRGLHRLLDLAQQHQAGIVAVEYKDRLARFGFTYLESYLHAFGVRVVVIESPVKDDPQELVEDLIAITTSFSARIYGKRRDKDGLDRASSDGDLSAGRSPRMKTTIFGVLLEVTPDQDTVLRRLMRKYGFMLRFAFQRLVGGLQNIGGLERHCASETELPLRYAKDAVQEAQDLIRARHQAMKDGATLWTQRVKKTRERLTALRASPHPNARRIAGQERKLTHQEAQQAFYQQHVEAGTFPPVVFGTKKRWWDRFKTLDDPIAEQARQQAWREEWDESRNGRLSARGDRTKRGNPLLRVCAGADHWILEISLDCRKPGKPDAKVPRYEKLAIPLYIARKVSKKTGQVNGRDYEGLLRRVLASDDPYQVEILRRQGRYQVRITVEEVPAPIQTDPRHGWVGVDTNSTFLALCHVLPNGNPHAFATIGDPRLFDVRSTQRDALVGGLAVETVQWAQARGAGLVVEDLQFIHDRDVSAKFNRVTHQFNYRALLMAVERQAAREGVGLRKVTPAYTSIIGRFKYQPQYGISVHHAAALVIGRRGGLKVRRENVPKALRLWMQDRDQWNDPTYRKNDWSAWARIKRIMTKTLASHHQYLSAWLGYRKTLFSK